MIAALQRATPSVALTTLAFVAVVPAISNASRAIAQPGAGAGSAAGPVAVLSFINISGDSADDWIGTGIAESLASDLNRAGVAAVRTETASLPRATEVGLGLQEAIVETGTTLGASALVTGAYQRVGDRLRITARVFDAGTAAVVGAATADGGFSDLFDVQDQVAAQVRDALTGGARRAGARPSAAPPPAAPDRLDPARPAPGAMTGIPRPGRGAMGDPPERGPGPATGRPGGRGPMAGRPGGPGPMAGRPGGRPGRPMTGGPGAGTGGAGTATGPASPAEPAGFSSLTAAPRVIIDGPPPPAAPEIVARDEAGRATVRAVRANTPLRVDGVLDDGIYETVPSIEGFVQQLPIEGAPTTERTEAWVFFDDENVYVSARLWTSVPESDWIANEMQRDSFQIINNDYFSVGIDTFYDRRNGFAFMITPIGGFFDYEITDEGNPNNDWNPIWNSSTGRFAGGWTVEMEIPFKSLRFQPGQNQVWGLQLGRRIRYRNETTYLTTVPISAGPGMFRLSAAGTLVGVEVPSGNRRFEIKPYAIGSVNGTLDSAEQIVNEGAGDGGIDVKYGLTQNLTADFTYNTDFAQVEADEAQLNLSRFNLFFPEKREFFLEGRGIFDFGRAAGNAGGQFRASRLGGSGFFGGGDVPTVFYSRRIGLTGGETVPILGGARLTGKAGRYSIGALNIQTDETGGALGTNFTALRVKRDILRRSRIGGIFTGRSVSVNGNDTNEAFGVDGAFSFYDNVNFYGYYARTRTRGLELDSDAQGKEESYQAAFNYAGDLYGLQVEHLVVGDAFNPEVGFVRRDDFLRNYALARYSPRPSMDLVRQFTWEGSYDYFENGAGITETRIAQGIFGIEFENSDRFSANYEQRFDFVPREFNAAGVVPIPVGEYDYQSIFLSYAMGQQRRVSGTLSLWSGDYYHGTINAVGYQRGRVEITPQFSLEPGLSVNHISLPVEGTYTVPLVTSRVTYTFTPRMFFGGLIQYSPVSDTISANLRLRWEYQPGSELFVVYNDQRDVADFSFGARRWPELQNRAFVIKFNRMFRF